MNPHRHRPDVRTSGRPDVLPLDTTAEQRRHGFTKERRPTRRPDVRTSGVIVLLLFSGLMMNGCRMPFFGQRHEPVQREILSYHTTIEAAHLRRVAVLPFHRAEGIGRSAGAMDENMTAALRELGLHEVLTVSVAERDNLLKRDVIRANRITTDELLALRDALKCDGVLIGRIEQFTSYDPIAIGVTADLVSCLDGSVLWSATGHFDGSRSDVQREVENWYDRAITSGGIAGWKQTLESPKLFTRYVAERLALSIPVPVAKK
jgi:hypothetical protein